LERLRDPEVPNAAPVTLVEVVSDVFKPKLGALAISTTDVAPKANGAGGTGVVLLFGGRLSPA
jgi:hypothetical protein